MEALIDAARDCGRIRFTETYSTTLHSFKRFLGGRDVLFKDITQPLMGQYERWLARNGVRRNTSSFYMRILRAAYNRGVDRGLVRQRYPFKYVYTGVDKTSKRAVSAEVIRALRSMDLDRRPQLAFARDIFLFSFYTRGMSFIDMAFLRPANIVGGRLQYVRRKTKRPLSICWEPCMQAIVDRYPPLSAGFLLPILHREAEKEEDYYRQYKTTLFQVNSSLRILSEELGLEHPLTTYVARHSWASIAWSKRIPMSVISEGMGHNTEKMTRIYLASLDSSEVDRANRIVFQELL